MCGGRLFQNAGIKGGVKDNHWPGPDGVAQLQRHIWPGWCAAECRLIDTMHGGGLRLDGDRRLQAGFKYHPAGRIGQADFQRFCGITQPRCFGIQKERRQTQPVVCPPCHPATGAVKPGQDGKTQAGLLLLLGRRPFFPHRNTVCNAVYGVLAAIGAFVPFHRLSTGSRLHSEFIAQAPFREAPIAGYRLCASCGQLIILHGYSISVRRL
ncbi:Uncharacterised protein [Klebsiella pneumoniae]|nr:Uncharacterised protein [Klebsiella pneumoniae]